MYGANIEFECAALVPDEVDFEIARRAISCTAAAGVVFANVHEESGVVPLHWARKLRASESANRRLKSRLDQILSEH
jgi:hypothetical protein